ncbi:MAG TPA: hypothetical protein VMU69_09425 [Bradyrhizobium sp.]|nr:hypothetical protein [Bradyrhizobium sp.]
MLAHPGLFHFLTAASLVAASALLPAAASGKTACTAELRHTRIAVNKALDQHAAASAYAPESKFATMNRQPTPATIARAEHRFDNWPNGSEAVAALARARQANKAGDVQGCLDALREARTAIGAAP